MELFCLLRHQMLATLRSTLLRPRSDNEHLHFTWQRASPSTIAVIASEMQQPTSGKGQLLDVTTHLPTVLLPVSFGGFALQNAHKLQLLSFPLSSFWRHPYLAFLEQASEPAEKKALNPMPY